MDIDVYTLSEAIKTFKQSSKPDNTTMGAPATVDDVRRVINGVAELAEAFIRELS